MSRLEWMKTGKKLFESGLDRAVVYPQGGNPAAWDGLININEKLSGGEARVRYLDGVKIVNDSGVEDFSGSIEAYMYPDEFAECDGTEVVKRALFIGQQRKRPFDLSYRTSIGNDIQGVSHGYKLHFIYNATAVSRGLIRSTRGQQVDPLVFGWDFTTRPVISGPSLRPTAHVFLDSRKTEPEVLKKIEDYIYGSSTSSPRMIPLDKLISYFPSLTIVDNGDGTWTATGSDQEVRFLDDETFEITSDTITYLDADTYTVRSVEG